MSIENKIKELVTEANALESDAKPAVVEVTGAKYQEDMTALFKGEDTLTEEFKEKAATIFEAAVVTRVNEEVEKLKATLQAEFDTKLDEEVQGLVENVDGFLSVLAEQWKADNEVALENSIKNELTENFISGLKTLFKENYIEVPDDKFDVLADVQGKLDDANAKLSEQVTVNADLLKQINESKKGELIAKISEGLTDLDADKFKTLCGELTFESADQFEKKLKTIRESYVSEKAKPAEITESVANVITDAAVIEEEAKPVNTRVVDPNVARFAAYINGK